MHHRRHNFSCQPLLTSAQTLYQEAIVWKRLEHQNIVPFLGITPSPLQLISEWMPGGDLTEYIKKHPDANRIDLVSAPSFAFDPTLTPPSSYLTSLAASTTSTPAISSMAILRGYVIVSSPFYHRLDPCPAKYSCGCHRPRTDHGFRYC